MNHCENPDYMKIKTFLAAAAVGLPMSMAAADVHGIETANLDRSVKPGEDFFQYACGGWMKANPLRPEYARFGMFDLLRDNAKEQLKELITNLSQDPQAKVKGTNAQKVSDLYALALDMDRRNAEGAAPVMPTVERINSASLTELYSLLGWLHNGISSGSFFSAGVGTDAKNSDVHALHVSEGGLQLGDRDYYLEDNETNRKIMAAYEAYVKRMMELIGYDAKAQQRVWDNVILLEKQIAKNKMTREMRRNPQLRYNPMSMAELKSNYPNIDWDTYFSTLGVKDADRVIVGSVDYLKAINDLLPTLGEQQVKDYLTLDAVTDASGALGQDFIDANFELFDRVMSGKEEQEPLWKQAMAVPNSVLGEAVGELYVAKYFPEENKAYMKTLVENLRTALGQHIDNLTWMSDSTKAQAHAKLATFTVKIGYPDKWKDYSGIEVDPSKSLAENLQKASVWYTQDNIKKLHEPVDKTEWHMTPQTVNAYYNPTSNEICFPAGILQAPYFDVTADDAQNYGAIGVVIGHEMTHGFDDSGRQFDKDGNLVDWWLPEDAERFTKLADELAAQFDAVEVAPGVHANGRYTLGENIADQGGLRVALTAYLNSLKGKEAKDIDGFSPLQRFYLAYANVWANNIRPEEVLVLTKTDSHSLGRNRVNVTLRNIAPFFEAFGIKEGDKMFRPEEERVVIW